MEQTSFRDHTKLLIRIAFRDLKWGRDMALGGLISVAGIALQAWWNLISRDDWKLHKWQWMGTAILPVIVILAIHIAWRVLSSPWRLYQGQEAEHEKEIKAANETIAKLCTEIRKLKPAVLEIGEEDPKVYIRPLNDEFISRGVMAFELLNDGQRVNPAEAITLHLVPSFPNVAFEYIDVLRDKEPKVIVPKINEDDLFPCHNILSVLEMAWRQAWESDETKQDAMLNDAEFLFEIKINYRDARSRTFQSTTPMRYCPIQHQAALQGRDRGNIIRVVQSDEPRIKRLS